MGELTNLQRIREYLEATLADDRATVNKLKARIEANHETLMYLKALEAERQDYFDSP